MFSVLFGLQCSFRLSLLSSSCCCLRAENVSQRCQVKKSIGSQLSLPEEDFQANPYTLKFYCIFLLINIWVFQKALIVYN